MLPRVLEPEVMDSPEEASDYDAMDHTVVNRAFVNDFLITRPSTDLILDVGTGTAQIPILLCTLAAAANIVAVDYAEHMLRVAAANMSKAGVADRIRLQRCDAKKLPFADNSFLAVMSNSIVHHIPEPRLVIEEMVRVTAPGGVIFVRDLLRPDNDEQVKQLVQTYAGEANTHQRNMFEASLHAALTLDEVRSLVHEHRFSPDTVRQTSDRHWTWVATKSL